MTEKSELVKVTDKETRSDKRAPRDWFGYILTAVIGIVVTVVASWYQLAASDRQATAAELERAKAVRQSVISIVEEQALNGKKLEVQRLTRLIDQRRREQNVSLLVAISDVVEQAEFNISSSPYLAVDRKEQIKPLFDSFYSELAIKSFKSFGPDEANADLLNELAKQIQEGKSTDALASLSRLQEIQSATMTQLSRKVKPTLLEAFVEFFKQPKNIVIFVFSYLFLLWFVGQVRRRRIRGYWGGGF